VPLTLEPLHRYTDQERHPELVIVGLHQSYRESAPRVDLNIGDSNPAVARGRRGRLLRDHFSALLEVIDRA